MPLFLPEGTEETELSAEIEAAGRRFRLSRYARPAIQESIAPARSGEPGFPALHLVLQRGGGNTWAGWLVPGSPVLGRAVSALAWIEYVPAPAPGREEALRQVYRTAYGNGPTLVIAVRRTGERFAYAARAGTVIEPPLKGWKIEILRVYRSYALALGAKRARDDPASLPNPAVELRIHTPRGKREAVLFAKYPEFSEGGSDPDADILFFNAALFHPGDRARLTIVDTNAGPLRIFAGAGKEVFEADLPAGRPLKVGELLVLAARRLPYARILQNVRPGPGPSGIDAVLLEWQDGRFPRKRWIPLGVPEELRSGGRIFVARLLRPGEAGGMHGHEGAGGSHGAGPSATGTEAGPK